MLTQIDGYKKEVGSSNGPANPPARQCGAKRLEEESETNLNLTACVGKVAVGVGNRAKGRVKRESGSGCGAANEVTCVVDAGDILMIEEIEGFAERFNSVTIAQTDSLGEAQVHVDGTWHPESATADNVNALATVRAVDPSTEGFVGDRRNVAGNGISTFQNLYRFGRNSTRFHRLNLISARYIGGFDRR